MQDDTRKRFFSSSDQTWATPPAFFKRLDDVFHFKLDPCASSKTAKCAKFFTKEDDGLKQDWATIGNTFVNPPFGRELPAWIEKSYDEAQGGRLSPCLYRAPGHAGMA